jgi:hypothetical protein
VKPEIEMQKNMHGKGLVRNYNFEEFEIGGEPRARVEALMRLWNREERK